MSAPTKPKPTDEEETKRLGLSPATVAGGALASVTSTVAASSLGTAGTLWGAGVASVISTVAAAFYSHTIKRGATKVTKVIPIGGGAIIREETKVLPAHLNPKTKPRRFDIKLNRKFWLRIALAALGMFALVMGVITGIELLTQKPVAALVGDTETSQSTTLGTVTHHTPSTPVPQDEQQEDEPVTTTAPDDEPTTTPERTAESTQITRTAESTAATSDTTEVTQQPQQEDQEEATEAPARTTAAPEPTAEAADTE